MINFASLAVEAHVAMVERCISDHSITNPNQASRVRLAGAMATDIAGQIEHRASIAGSGEDGTIRLLEIFVPETDRSQFVTDDQYERAGQDSILPGDRTAFDSALKETRSRVFGLILYSDGSPYVREPDLALPPTRSNVVLRGPHPNPTYFIFSGPDTPTTLVHYDAVGQVMEYPFLADLSVVSRVNEHVGPESLHRLDDKELRLILGVMALSVSVEPERLLANL